MRITTLVVLSLIVLGGCDSRDDPQEQAANQTAESGSAARVTIAMMEIGAGEKRSISVGEEHQSSDAIWIAMEDQSSLVVEVSGNETFSIKGIDAGENCTITFTPPTAESKAVTKASSLPAVPPAQRETGRGLPHIYVSSGTATTIETSTANYRGEPVSIIMEDNSKLIVVVDQPATTKIEYLKAGENCSIELRAAAK